MAGASSGARGRERRGRSAPANALRSPRRAHATAATFLGLALLFAGLLVPSAASAALSYPFDSQLAPSGGTFNGVAPNGIAVDDSSGKTYVASSPGGGSGRPDTLYVFETSTTTQLPSLDGSTTPAGSFGTGRLALAADNTSGRLYVLDPTHNVVDEFNAAGAFLCQITAKTPVSTEEKEHECNGATGSDTPSHGFNGPEGIAVDQATHELYVGDISGGAIDVFSAAGAYLRGVSLAPVAAELSGEGTGLAVNDKNGDLYMTNAIPPVVFVFDAASGAHLATWTGANTPAGHFGGAARIDNLGVAADNSSGRVYVTETFANQSESIAAVDVFEVGGEYITSRFGRPIVGPGSAAVDQASGRLYFHDRFNEQGVVEAFGPGLVIPDVITEGSGEGTPTSATLKGSVNPDEIPLKASPSEGCFFEYDTTEYTEGEAPHGTVAPCAEPDAEEVGEGNAPVPVKAHIAGLKIGTVYHFRLFAANANGQNEGEDRSFETLPPPQVLATTSENLTETSVDLSAEVNPRGAETSCVIEYGETTEPDNPAVPYQQTEPCNPASLGTGNSPVPVSLHLEGLLKGTTYHWRVAATNPSGTTDSPDQTFVYLTPEPPPPGSCPANEAFRTGASAALPDCRAYEQVTPTTKNGSLIGAVLLGYPPDFAAGGSRLILSSVACFGGSLSCPVNRGGVGASFAFQRTAAGWSTTPLSPPATQFGSSSTWTVGAEQGNAIYSAPTPPSGEDHAYLRRPDGSFVDIGPASPPAAGPQGPIGSQSADTKASTADLSHYVFGVLHPVWPFDETKGTGESTDTLYEYVGTGNSEPLLVGVNGPKESHDLISTCGTDLGRGSSKATAQPGALSADGRTVYFTATGGKGCVGSGANAATEVPANTLYARIDGEEASARTVAVSAPQCGAGPGADEVACRTAPPADAEFQAGAEDGSLAYFTSTQQLTDEASEDSHQGDSANEPGCSVTSGPGGCNLYLYDFKRPEGQRLIDVSAGDTSGKGPQVQGAMAISGDGSHVYFVAKGVLAANPGAATDPASGQPQKAEAGAENLYLYDTAGAQTTFIATLPASDNEQGKGAFGLDEEWSFGPAQANLTPDGRYLVFTSHAALTPDAAPTGVIQVFRYDAQAKALIRLSVGERGFDDNGNSPAETHCKNDHCPDAATIAIPSAFLYFAGPPRRDPTMSHDGARVFFQSPLALTPGALDQKQIGTGSNGPIYAQNLYQWEAQGTGSCEEAPGCVRLVSDGRDTTLAPSATCGAASAVCFIGASASGKDAFFTSADRLTPTDTDTQVDYYDARVGGGFAESANIVPCPTADACHPGTTAEGSNPPPSTPGFEGPGNGRYCPKGSVLKGAKCVKKHVRKHHKRHHHHHKRANTNRRAGR